MPQPEFLRPPVTLEIPPEVAEQDDKPHDECGVFAILASNQEVVELAVAGAMELQNRGESAAGVMYIDGDGVIRGHKGNGAVPKAIPQAFVGPHISYPIEPDEKLPTVAVSHVRYSTDASDSAEGAQPFKGERSNLIFATNGNIPRVEDTAEGVFGVNVSYGVTDSHKLSILLDELTAMYNGNVALAMETALPYIDGAYCIAMTDGEHVYAARDPWGFHPLAIGKLPAGGSILASESVAFDAIGGEFIRDVKPGEIIVLDQQGEVSTSTIAREAKPSRCMYEFMYTSRPDGVLDGVPVFKARYNLGIAAAEAFARRGIEADCVVGVPDSALPATHGFVNASGLELVYGAYKNPGAKRSFLLRAEDRANALKGKLRVIKSEVEGKRIVIVDDSMIKGNTNKVNVTKFKAAGATEVHIVIAAPPYTSECYMGMDTADKDELIAANMTNKEMCDYLGADSITYLTPAETQQVFDKTAEAYRADLGKMCMACSTGEYPFPVPKGKDSATSGVGRVALGMPTMPVVRV